MPPVTSRKRKSPNTGIDEEAAARAIFQKHFEAQFEPLPQSQSQSIDPRDTLDDSDDSNEDHDDDDEEEDGDEDGGSNEDVAEEWGGISDDEDTVDAVEVQVVDHSSKSDHSATLLGKREHKAFMSSRPPTHEDDESKKPADALLPTANTPEDARTLMSQDLELHRLITESHLLDPHSKLHSKPFADGRIRMHTADHRITTLAPGTTSILSQKSMPMSMRKGIETTKKGREDLRRKEATENGVVLERKGGGAGGAGGSGAKGKNKKKPHARVDMPGIGRMKGSELTLSESDIKSIESSGSFRGGSRGRGTKKPTSRAGGGGGRDGKY